MFEVRFDLGLEGSGFWQRRGVLSHGKASARKRGGGQADLSVQSPVGTPQVRPSGVHLADTYSSFSVCLALLWSMGIQS